MNYLNTKEASEKWGISTRRITQLAKQGRIGGAVLRDRRWLIPENAPKPEDPRSRAAKEAAEDDGFVFPHIIATVRSKAQVDGFSPDEQSLYRVNCLFEAGKLEECILELKTLLPATDNRYIRLGALYLLSLACFYLADMEGMSEYAAMFKILYYEDDAHRSELTFLLDCFDAEVSDGQGFSFNLTPDGDFDYPDDIIPYISIVNAMADLVNSTAGAYPANILSHEIVCAKIEREGYFYCSMMLHSYMSLMYAVRRDPANEKRHLRQAIDIAVEHQLYFSLAETLFFAPDTPLELLGDYPHDVARTIRHCASKIIQARVALSKHSGRGTKLAQLSQDDYVLVSYCLKDYRIGEIAELLSLSESGAKKRLTTLYQKLEVRSRSEMLAKYVALVLNTDIEDVLG